MNLSQNYLRTYQFKNFYFDFFSKKITLYRTVCLSNYKYHFILMQFFDHKMKITIRDYSSHVVSLIDF